MPTGRILRCALPHGGKCPLSSVCWPVARKLARGLKVCARSVCALRLRGGFCSRLPPLCGPNKACRRRRSAPPSCGGAPSPDSKAQAAFFGARVTQVAFAALAPFPPPALRAGRAPLVAAGNACRVFLPRRGLTVGYLFGRFLPLPSLWPPAEGCKGKGKNKKALPWQRY